MAEEGYKVSLHVYDLSQGLARQLSTTFLGKAIEGIWHTGVIVYGNEYYFGGGIQHSPVGATPYGRPLRVVDLGVTHIPKEVFEEYLTEISPRYTAETYSLLHHNCNNFSNEVAQFLVGATIPDYILQLPNVVMGSPMGAMILPMIQQLETTLRAGAVPQVPQFRPPAANPLVYQPKASSPTSTTPNMLSPTSLANNSADGSPKPDSRPKERDSENDSVKATELGAPIPSAADKVTNRTAADPLGEARGRVQDEICREFAAIMATGTLRASEAAALATRRVMEKHRRLDVSPSQS